MMSQFKILKVEGLPHFFDLKRISDADQQLAIEIHTSLHSVGRYCEQFGAAVQLFDYSLMQMSEWEKLRPSLSRVDQPPAVAHLEEMENQIRVRRAIDDQADVYGKWTYIAARDGAISLYNLHESMRIIRTRLSKCPSLLDNVDRKLLKEARQIFSKRFPDFLGLRHAVAHSAEMLHEEEANSRKHGAKGLKDFWIFKGEPGAVYIGESLNGRQFMNTVNGKVLSYEISLESFDIAKSSARAFISAFHTAINPFFLRNG